MTEEEMPDQMRLAYLTQNIMEYLTEFLEGQTTMAGVCNGYKYTVKFSRVGPESVEEVEKGRETLENLSEDEKEGGSNEG